MALSVDHFQTLCERFPSWSELRDHLQSDAGGKLRCIDEGEGSNFEVIRYSKGASIFSHGTGLFRSVVWDKAANRPLCYAPPQAKEGQPPLHTNFAAVEDFVDGFMMNVFVTAAEPSVLRMATRTKIGGENRFFSKKMFSVLFEECLASTPVRTLDALKMHLREALGTENISAFASFVVQHPEHRIVAKVASPDLHMVHMGTVAPSGALTVHESAATWPAALRRLQIARYPIKQFHSEQEIQELMRRTAVNNGFRWQGLVFKDGTGARWRLRSPSYLMMRGLRGLEAYSIDRFLRLRREGKVSDYLKHYGEDRELFWALEQNLRSKTAQVLTAYEQVHKAHTSKFADLPAGFKPAVYHLHLEYLNVLREKKFKVLLRNAIDAVNRLQDYEQKRLLDAAEFTPLEPVAEPVAA